MSACGSVSVGASHGLRDICAKRLLVVARHVFDIGGNKYRLISEINFTRRVLFIRRIMTHKEYVKRRLQQGSAARVRYSRPGFGGPKLEAFDQQGAGKETRFLVQG